MLLKPFVLNDLEYLYVSKRLAHGGEPWVF